MAQLQLVLVGTLLETVCFLFEIPTGVVADRYSRRKVITGSLLVWSSVTWATGFATTYEELLWTRALMGISA